MSSLKLDQEESTRREYMSSHQVGFGFETMIHSGSNSDTNFYSNSHYKPKSRFNSPEKPEYFVSIATTQLNLPLPDKI